MRMLRLFLLAAVLICAAAPAQAAKRALVIGNGAYLNTPALANPARDAAAFAEFLEGTGFEVTLLADADRAVMSKALAAFSESLAPSDTAVFFYAGHGVQLEGQNYLLGVEAQLASELDIPAETLSLSSVVTLLERRARLAMLFIDACRNNPLLNRLERDSTRSLARGLAPVASRGDGTMIAFAAEPDQLAYDGEGGNSPFTAALIRHLATPGLEVATAFKRVIAEVRIATRERQSPQMLSNLAAEFYFGTGGSPGAAIDLAQLDYEKAERVGTKRGWQLFLTKHPDGFYADLARGAMVALDGSLATDTLSPAEAEKALGLTAPLRREVQIALASLGYDVGAPDGVFGANTRRQLARYQASLGIQETGFVSANLLSKLNIAHAGTGDAVFSADQARKFDVADLQGLESDPRLLVALDCLKARELKYGFSGDSLYIAVLTWGELDWLEARNEAQRCGGHLLTISSQAESEFAFALFSSDERFVRAQSDGQLSGPFIGLFQQEGAREPEGGWAWVTGEPITFSNWSRGQPNNFGGVAHYGALYSDPQEDSGRPILWDDVDITNGSSGYVMELGPVSP